MSLNALARSFGQICLEAAIPVMEVYESDFTAEQKADKSPVTEADKRAEVIILDALSKLLPDTPVLAEESFEAGVRPSVSDEFLLVDPVDGTKEFIAKRGEFTINIALIRKGVPVAGAVYAPALKQLYLGGETAFTGTFEPGETLDETRLSKAQTRPTPDAGMTAVMSRSHADEQTKAFAEARGVVEAISAGSSLKFCKLAEGAADLYPRFGPTMEWDTAAGHAVLNAAGGAVTEPDGAPFRYGKTADGYKNGAFVAWGQPPH
jgi:3'(2'), 5'-bisphosphate nucleotidase